GSGPQPLSERAFEERRDLHVGQTSQVDARVSNRSGPPTPSGTEGRECGRESARDLRSVSLTPVVRRLATHRPPAPDSAAPNAGAGDCNTTRSAGARGAAGGPSRTARHGSPRPSANERTTPYARCPPGPSRAWRSAGCPGPGGDRGTAG